MKGDRMDRALAVVVLDAAAERVLRQTSLAEPP
jgi:hypothetical protein